MPKPPACCERRATLPATIEAVEAFIADMRDDCLCRHDEQFAFSVELLLRETLVNAVAHGSRSEPHGHVRCVLRLRRRMLTLVVVDEGAGFDWRAARVREPQIDSTSGRGLEILRKYATRVRFNDKGNTVMIMKRM